VLSAAGNKGQAPFWQRGKKATACPGKENNLGMPCINRCTDLRDIGTAEDRKIHQSRIQLN
jgi:hypothetical protein